MGHLLNSPKVPIGHPIPPATRMLSIPEPVRFSFEYHWVAGNLKNQVWSNVLDIPEKLGKAGHESRIFTSKNKTQIPGSTQEKIQQFYPTQTRLLPKFCSIPAPNPSDIENIARIANAVQVSSVY